MQIQALHDSGSGDVNEDVVLIANPVFGVFDGATSLRSYRDGQGRTGGYLAASIAQETFLRGSREDRDGKSLYHLAQEANEAIGTAMRAGNVDVADKLNLWSTTATVVRIKPHEFDWVHVGDSVGLVVYNDNSFEFLTPYHDHDQRWLVLWKELAERGSPYITERIQQEVEVLRREMNERGGYGALSGEAGMTQFLHHGTRSLQGVKHLLLFTDGLLAPKSEPSQPYDFEKLAALFVESGLERMVAYVRNLERDDKPGGIAPRRFYKHFYKQHDDIGAIALSF